MTKKEKNDLILKIAEYGYYKQLQGLSGNDDYADYCHQRFKEIQEVINGSSEDERTEMG